MFKGDLAILAIHICIRLRKKKRLVVVYDWAGIVRAGRLDNPHNARYTRIGEYAHPCDRSFIEEDLRFAAHAWSNDK